MASNSLSHLRLLSQIITDSINVIEGRLTQASVSFPSLDEPFNPTSKVESVLVEPDVIKATSHIVAAAAQLIATVRHPAQTIIDNAFACHLSSCIRAAIDGSLVEIVREAGPQGIHANDIAVKNNTDPLKVARILRFLTNNHIFREITPDVFASNRLSSVLDSGKPSKEIVANPTVAHRHIGTSGVAAYAALGADEIMKGSAYIPEAFLDPRLSFAIEPTETPWNKAFGTNLSIFDWYNQEDSKNHSHSQRFVVSMIGTTKMEPDNALLTGFQWKDLPKGSTVVDVGGGIGSSSLIIAKAVPNLNIVIQDRPPTIADAEEFWKTNMPSAITSGRVKLQVHDFFDPQPIKDASVFLLRHIVIDWADPYAKKILKNLRASAMLETKLVISEPIVPYSCAAVLNEEIPGAAIPSVPAPLLPSLGKVSSFSYQADLTMWALYNSQGRTLGHYVSLLAECSWKVIQVHHISGSTSSHIVSVPV